MVLLGIDQRAVEVPEDGFHLGPEYLAWRRASGKLSLAGETVYHGSLEAATRAAAMARSSGNSRDFSVEYGAAEEPMC